MKKKKLQQVKQVAETIGNLAEILYKRDDTTLFVVKGQDVPEEFAAATPSYVLYWRLPDNRDVRGNLIRLYHTKVMFHNDSPYSLLLRAARPYGFLGDAEGIAIWETVWKEFEKEVKPRSTLVAHLNHAIDPNQLGIGPRRVVIHAGDHLHCLSFSIRRNVVADSGVTVSTEDLKQLAALRVEAITTYESSGNSNGEVMPYNLRRYATTDHMEHVNTPPPLPVSLGQLRVAQGQVQYARLVPVGGVYNYAPSPLRFSSDPLSETSRADAIHADGLDINTVYAVSVGPLAYKGFIIGTDVSGITYMKFPNTVTGKEPVGAKTRPRGSAKFLVYKSKGSVLIGNKNEAAISTPEGWYFYHTRPLEDSNQNGEDGMAFYFCDPNVKGSDDHALIARPTDAPIFDQETKFTPDNNDVKRKNFLKDMVPCRKIQMRTLRVDRKLHKTAYTSDFRDKILTGISIIVSVAKTTIAIATVLGLAQNLATHPNTLTNLEALDTVAEEFHFC